MRTSTLISKTTQEQQVLNVLLDAAGQWVNKQFFVRDLYLTQSGRAIWCLENDPRWVQELARLGVRIEHSTFTDSHGFKSYRILKLGPQTLF